MKKPRTPADYIVPLNMNGMQGRMLHLPAPKSKKREILFVYGHHSSLERWWGLMEHLNRYGAVTMPDLPGFGGMDSFYTIGKSATIDNLADYLAAFVKMRYKRRRVTITGMSFGFVVVTRMLQRYPELTKKVDLLVSLVGFARYDDFIFSKPRYLLYRWGASFFSRPVPAWFFRHVALSAPVLRLVYAKTFNAKHKFAAAKDKEDFKRLMDVEIDLWQNNDVRTYMASTVQFLTFDNCNVRVDLPVWHVSVKADRYFDENSVEQHMQVIFSDFHSVKSQLDTHAPSVISDAKMAAPMVPAKLRRVLSKQ